LWPHTATLRREVILGRTLQLLDDQGRIERSNPLGQPEDGTGTVAWACTSVGVFLADVVAEGVVRLRHGTGKEWGRIRAPTRAHPNLFAISPDRKWAAVNWITPAGWSLRGYDSSGAERVHFADLHIRSLWSLAFSPDGALLASASDDGTGGVWEVATGRAIGGALRHPGNLRLRSATFRADVTRLVTTSGDGTACQWDARTGAAVEPPYDRHTGEVWTAVYSPDGQWVASAGTDRTIRLWLSSGRQEALVLQSHTGKVTQLAFTGDGRRLQSVSDDGTARIWGVEPRAHLPALRDHTDNVYAVAYSPDGQWIASGSWDRSARLWDARTEHLCATLPHPGFVQAPAFSPDGSWLVSGCDAVDRLRIWDFATGQLRREVPGREQSSRPWPSILPASGSRLRTGTGLYESWRRRPVESSRRCE
jgi:WD40 repeat protein